MNCTPQILFISNSRFKSSKVQHNTLQILEYHAHIILKTILTFCLVEKEVYKMTLGASETIYVPNLLCFHAL